MSYIQYGSGLNQLMFGDGSTGDVNLVADYTMTEDAYCNNLIVNAGVTVITAGYRIFVKNVCELYGTIQNNGGNASGTTAGAGATTGVLGGGSTGGAGQSGLFSATGLAGTNITSNALGGRGASGGSAGGTSGGAAGTMAITIANEGGPNCISTPPCCFLGKTCASSTTNKIYGGSGAGGGAISGIIITGTSGAGGGGAGIIMLYARILYGTGTITANGGNGSDASSGNAGGGGGGGAGIVIVGSTVDLDTTGITIIVNGGTPGNGTGSGTAGSTGSTGKIIKMIITE